jgi:hypothetical protein
MQETNGHPFRYEKWLFVHNAEVHAVDEIGRELVMRIASELPPVQRRRRETRRRLRDASRMLRRTALLPPHIGVGARALGGATMPASARAVV